MGKARLDRDDVLKVVTATLEKYGGKEPGSITYDQRLDSLDVASIDVIEAAFEIEAAFDVTIDIQVLPDVATVGDLVDAMIATAQPA